MLASFVFNGSVALQTQKVCSMIPHQRGMNPFIAWMVDDMKIRNFADTTIDAYTWHVDKFCQHFGL
jgi:hypothetical protein